MKIILLVLLLIPIFTFQVFIIINTISTMNVPARIESADVKSITSDGKRSTRKSILKVIR